MKPANLERTPVMGESAASAREDERRRLARDLHDGPAQALAAALFGMDLAVNALDRSAATAREDLLSARELLRDALNDVRALMSGLRPRLLDERGLVVALRALAGGTPLWGPTVTVEAHGIGTRDRLAPEIELGIYRIAQEAISNARRHAAATRVRVVLHVDAEAVSLDVADNGHGFIPERVRPVAGRGEGLPGMRERVAPLGGQVRIESAPGSGTRVVVFVPLPARGAAFQEGA